MSSMCFWFKQSSVDFSFQLGFNGSAGFYFQISFEQIELNPNYTAIWKSTATSLVAGSWHHIAGIYNGGTPSLALYLDGQFISGSLSGGAIPSTLGAVASLGHFGVNNAPNSASLVQDVRLYNTILQPWQISEIYRQGAS